MSPTNSFEVELIGVAPITDGQKIKEEVSQKTGKKQMVTVTLDSENVLIMDKKTGGIILQNKKDTITKIHRNEDACRRLGYVFETLNGDQHLVEIKTKKKTYPLLLEALLELQLDGERKTELAELRRKNEGLERELEETSKLEELDKERKNELAELRRKNEALERELEDTRKQASTHLATSDEQQRKMEELDGERKIELAELRRKNEALESELEDKRKQASTHLARLDEQQKKMEELDGQRKHELAVLCRKIEELGIELEKAREQASSCLAKTNSGKETNPTPSTEVRGKKVTFGKTITVHIIEPEEWEKKSKRRKGKHHRT